MLKMTAETPEVVLRRAVSEFLSDLNSVTSLPQKTKNTSVTIKDLKDEIENKIKEKKATDIMDFFGVNISEVYSKSDQDTKRAIIEHLLELIKVSNAVNNTANEQKCDLVRLAPPQQQAANPPNMGNMIAQLSQMGIDIPQLMTSPEVQQMAPSLMSILQPDILSDPQAIMKVANAFGQQIHPGFNFGTLMDIFERRFSSGEWIDTDKMENADFLIMMIGDPEIRPIINNLPIPKFSNKNAHNQ
jgi:DNA primase